MAQVTGPRDDLAIKFLLYNITKAAVLHGAKLEAAEPRLTSRHITVAAICPGWCRVRALLRFPRSTSSAQQVYSRRLCYLEPSCSPGPTSSVLGCLTTECW